MVSQSLAECFCFAGSLFGCFHEWSSATEWAGMQFQTHRRAPSDARSDVSSSAAPSPFLPQQESFEQFEPSPSPMMHPQPDPQIFNDGLDIGNFSISDNQQHVHSPDIALLYHHVCRHSLGSTSRKKLALCRYKTRTAASMGYLGPRCTALKHSLNSSPERDSVSNDMGQATQMAPPEINVNWHPRLNNQALILHQV